MNLSPPSNGLENDSNMPTIKQLLGVEQDSRLVDGVSRYRAINPFESFIVQAPAGSGKTALLTQRFLALLTQVEQPEQIVAMTFTKKAAAEMRDRIMGALKLGLLPKLPDSATLNDLNTWQLAKRALQRDHDQAWSLLQNPNRLRIKTIDGLNSYLVGQMPLLSKMGAQSKISHNVDSAYQEAVHLTLKNAALGDAVARLLGLVNGRFNRAENLLMSMLKKRDQWMGNLLGLTGEEARDRLENALEMIVLDELKHHVANLSHVRPLLAEACELADYSVQHDQPALESLCGAWPLSDSLEDVPAWQALADWLLTKDSKGIRKSVTKNNGFPAGKGEAKERKDQFLNLLAGLREGGHGANVLQSLAVLKTLPEPHYSDEQWLDLQWLIQLLRVSAAYLKVVFQSTGQADFIEVAQAASQALGSELAPTDLAQQLDYQVKHLLVDEFQDTSSEQYALITKLIAGWQAGDQRTLFIVGDPMQSIYRFREAEVGNFLKAWKGAIGDVSLTPLTLQVNFRSTQGVVDWVNQQFKKVLPKANNIEKGAVAYSDSKAFSTDDQPAVKCHWAINRSHEEEAFTIVNLIQQRLAEFVDGDGKSIALLGRSRSSLMGIARLLKQRGIAFRAVDLEVLNERQEVQDVLALSRALLHLSDRAAWIALLRSPLIGLSLNDLYALMGDAPYQTAWECLMPALNEAPLQDEILWHKRLEPMGLSVEGAQRLMGVLPILQQALVRIGSIAFSTLVRETWIQLDGPQTVENHLALENVEVFCHSLAGFDGEAIDFKQLELMVETLFARADSSPDSLRVELMTMHKSKGLEFDTVILPGLGRKPRGNDAELVSWFQFLAEDGAHQEGEYPEFESQEQLVIAPITQKGQPISRLSQLLKRFEAEKQSYELGRLLYVAATRAKQKLHLFGQISAKEPEVMDATLYPVKDSMLEALWPCIETDFVRLLHAHEFVDTTAVQVDESWPKVSRLPLQRTGFSSLEVSQPRVLGHTSNALGQSDDELAMATREQESSQQSLLANRQALLNTSVGNLVHAVLEQLVYEGIECWNTQRLKERLPFYKQWLAQQGLKGDELLEGVRRVERSLQNAADNQLLGWALSNAFLDSQTEYPLTSLEEDGAINNHIVDRTFVDESGVRWIVDYKTSVYDGADAESFIERQVQLYQPQLERYGRLFDVLEQRPQKWVLYFSYLNEWRELN